MKSPSTHPFPKAIVPAEAKLYCDHRGFISWKKVVPIIAARLSIDPKSIWTYQLSKILTGQSEDCYGGALAIMRELGLDRVVNFVALDPRSSIQQNSNAKAIRYAEDFGISLEGVVGSGPNGMILKRDVVAHHRGLKIGRINAVAADLRLLRQRRILADHLRECIRTNRVLCGTLAATQDARRRDSDERDARFADAHGRYRREVDELTNRLAATANALGDAKADLVIEKIANATLAEQLQHEQESNSRLEAKVHRLSSRPRMRRGTTHVEIGGIVYRNRTGLRAVHA